MKDAVTSTLFGRDSADYSRWGRFYENGSFKYILQIHECPKTNRSKIKVKKWVDTPDLKKYEKFVNDWHYFLKDLEHGLEENGSLDIRRTVVMYVLNQFT